MLLNTFISNLDPRTGLWNAKMIQLWARKRTKSSHRENEVTLWGRKLNRMKFKSKKYIIARQTNEDFCFNWRFSRFKKWRMEESWWIEWLRDCSLPAVKRSNEFLGISDISSQLRVHRSHLKQWGNSWSFPKQTCKYAQKRVSKGTTIMGK